MAHLENGRGGQGHGQLVQQFMQADSYYMTELTELNGSGVTGGAIVFVEDGEATVVAAASGVEEGQLHPMHIHGFGGSPDATTPTPDADAQGDGDGYVELAEGAATYGPVQEDITPGVTGGSFFYVESFEFDDDTSNGDLTAANLDAHEVVLHGMTLEAGEGSNGGEADGTAGYKTVLPIAAGELTEYDPHGAKDLAMLLALSHGETDGFMLG